MEPRLEQLHKDFWNFRGSQKIAKIIDIGTHMSLVRRANGRFIVLDSYGLDDDSLAKLRALTGDGQLVDSIVNLHPFHTLHCSKIVEALPGARLIGTRRHLSQLPDLPWDPNLIEDTKTQSEFAEDLAFSIPEGVDFISANEKVHVGSVIARHRASGIVHVDDTINVLEAPGILSAVMPDPTLSFHPMLAKALEERNGAADDYARWARDLARDWSGTSVVCAAHSATRHLEPGGWEKEIIAALDNVEDTLAKHRDQHG
jgi:hypothetical protein